MCICSIFHCRRSFISRSPAVNCEQNTFTRASSNHLRCFNLVPVLQLVDHESQVESSRLSPFPFFIHSCQLNSTTTTTTIHFHVFIASPSVSLTKSCKDQQPDISGAICPLIFVAQRPLQNSHVYVGQTRELNTDNQSKPDFFSVRIVKLVVEDICDGLSWSNILQ